MYMRVNVILQVKQLFNNLSKPTCFGKTVVLLSG
jgi:hypothetical protein